MPIRLIATIILMTLVALFTGKNWGNSCEVWPISSLTGLGNIQVSLIIIVSFILGVLITLPFTVIKKKPRQKPATTPAPVAEKPAETVRPSKKARKRKAKSESFTPVPVIGENESLTAEESNGSSHAPLAPSEEPHT